MPEGVGAERRPVPPAVVFVCNNLTPPHGMASAVDVLVDEMRGRGITVQAVVRGPVATAFRQRFPIFQPLPLRRLTTDVPGFASSRPLLRPFRRAFSAVWWPLVRRRMRRYLSTLPPDSLVIGVGQETLELVLEAGPLPVPSVVQTHTSFDALTPDQLARTRRCAQSVDVTTALTGDDATRLREAGIVPAVGLPNAVPIGDAAPEDGPTRRRSVVFMGRLVTGKQLDHLIRAFAAADVPGWVLEIYGRADDPEVERSLRALASSTGAAISFVGPVEDVAPVLATAGLHALSSVAEGLPMVVLEASANGLATVAYDCAPGVREALSDHGVLVPPQDETALARALRALMLDSDERERRGAAARADAEARFSPSIVVDRWLDLWEVIRSDGGPDRFAAFERRGRDS